MVIEADEDFRGRIINAYGMGGAFCTVVLESSGADIDACGVRMGLIRLSTADHDPGDEDRR